MAAPLKSFNYSWPHWTTDKNAFVLYLQHKAEAQSQQVSIMGETLSSTTALE